MYHRTEVNLTFIIKKKKKKQYTILKLPSPGQGCLLTKVHQYENKSYFAILNHVLFSRGICYISLILHLETVISLFQSYYGYRRSNAQNKATEVKTIIFDLMLLVCNFLYSQKTTCQQHNIKYNLFFKNKRNRYSDRYEYTTYCIVHSIELSKWES